MNVKLFTGDKEIITPKFEIDFNEEKKIIAFCIKNYNKEQQNIFLKLVKKINKENIILNDNYVSIVFKNEIYFFDIKTYKEYNLTEILIKGKYDLMFAFIDENDIIIENVYTVIKLNGYLLKKL